MSTGPNQSTVDLVLGRSGGWCLRCAVKTAVQVHHRKPRGMGGTKDPKINSLSNLVGVCFDCHVWIESHRKDSYRDGWLVARNANPAEQYLITLDHHMIMLLSNGGMEVNGLPDNYDEVPF